MLHTHNNYNNLCCLITPQTFFIANNPILYFDNVIIFIFLSILMMTSISTVDFILLFLSFLCYWFINNNIDVLFIGNTNFKSHLLHFIFRSIHQKIDTYRHVNTMHNNRRKNSWYHSTIDDFVEAAEKN